MEANERKLSALPSQVVVYLGTETGTLPESAFRTKLLSELLVEDVLRLKIDAPVMLLKNISSRLGLVNGTLGTVVGFATAEEYGETPTPLYSKPPGQRTKGEWPIVKFFGPKGTEVIVQVFRHEFSITARDGTVLVRRIQACPSLSHRPRPRVLPFRLPFRSSSLDL